jgi:putative transposase
MGPKYNIHVVIRKAYKYRLKTRPETGAKLRQFAGCCRFVWNKALAVQKERIDSKESCLSYNKLASLLCEWKSDPETSFFNEAHSQILQQSLRNLDRAIRDAFDKNSPRRFPRFKKKGVHDTFQYPQGFKINGSAVYLPKIGWVSFFKSREIEGVPRNVTVSRKGRYWFVSIQTGVEVAEPVHPCTSSVGIDMGVRRFATLSDGTFYEPANSFRALEKKLSREQRKLSRKRKWSQNWHRQKDVISRLHIRIADTRNDYLHKISTTISKNHAVVVMEDLKVANMSASAKGTIENPGKNVKEEAGLNKAVLDQGWYGFRRMLEYKLLWRGGTLVTVDPRYTSQECPRCHHISPDNRKRQELFSCSRCGYAANADLVAAINILAAGHAVSACGETGPQDCSVKQEPSRVAA